MPEHEQHAEHSVEHYNKILYILLALAFVSYLGPMVGDRFGLHWLTMLSAFGIAIYKAGLVIKHFMHLTIERRYVLYLLITGVAFMFLFFAGTSPDVMNHQGRNWVNVAAKAEIDRALKAHAEGGDQHGGDHHGDTAAEGH